MTAVFASTEWADRYEHVDKVLTRPGPFTEEGFTPGRETQDFLRTQSRILVIGE